MSGLITKAQMLAVTMTFAAALIAVTVNMYFLTTQYARDLVSKYEVAVTTQTGGTWVDLSNQSEVSYPYLFKVLYASTDTYYQCNLYEIGKPVKSIEYGDMYYFLKNSQKFAKVDVSTVSGKTIISIMEVAK